MSDIPKIDTFSNGINAAEQALKDVSPYDGAIERFADTQRTLVLGHNDALDRLSALEARIPFPFRASSTQGGA